MTRDQVVLAALAAGKGDMYTPVKVQKLLFLLDRKAAEALDGPHFDFRPYHYGPFDKGVYDVLDELASKEFVEVRRNPETRWKTFRLTPAGQEEGETLLNGLDPGVKSYIQKLAAFVQSLSFSQLVSTIYKSYPEMKANSVFNQ